MASRTQRHSTECSPEPARNEPPVVRSPQRRPDAPSAEAAREASGPTSRDTVPHSGVRRISRRGQRIFTTFAFGASAVSLFYVGVEALRPAHAPLPPAVVQRRGNFTPVMRKASSPEESALTEGAARAMANEHYAEALKLYTSLSQRWPEVAAYRAMTKVLQRRRVESPAPPPAARALEEGPH